MTVTRSRLPAIACNLRLEVIGRNRALFCEQIRSGLAIAMLHRCGPWRQESLRNRRKRGKHCRLCGVLGLDTQHNVGCKRFASST